MQMQEHVTSCWTFQETIQCHYTRGFSNFGEDNSRGCGEREKWEAQHNKRHRGTMFLAHFTGSISEPWLTTNQLNSQHQIINLSDRTTFLLLKLFNCTKIKPLSAVANTVHTVTKKHSLSHENLGSRNDKIITIFTRMQCPAQKGEVFCLI